MKAVFIPAQYAGDMDLNRIELEELPRKVGIVTTAQFMDKTKDVIKFLEEKGKKVFVDKIKQRNEGQLLGCDVGAATKIEGEVDAFLYIGSGDFHPLGVAMSTKKDVFLFNPVSGVFSKFNREEIEKYEKKKKIKYSKFLHANDIGILVSTKPGQYSHNRAVEIRKTLEKRGKKCFIFVFDTLDAAEMNNFPFIDFWINTACPRIADDKDKKNVVDMGDLNIAEQDCKFN